MESILITGSYGFIGSHLTDFCVNKNHEVYSLDRPSASFENLTHYTNGREKFSKEDKLLFFGEKIQFPSSIKKLIFLECDIKNAVLLGKIILKFIENRK